MSQSIKSLPQRFRAALDSRDRDAVEDLVVEVHLSIDRGDDCATIIPYLIQLLPETWHAKHEDIALALQWLRAEDAVDALLETAFRKYDYLDFDNSYALARKCTWALADIGTKEAFEALVHISESGDPEVSGYAQKRIDRWDLEVARKAGDA